MTEIPETIEIEVRSFLDEDEIGLALECFEDLNDEVELRDAIVEYVQDPGARDAYPLAVWLLEQGREASPEGLKLLQEHFGTDVNWGPIIEDAVEDALEDEEDEEEVCPECLEPVDEDGDCGCED